MPIDRAALARGLGQSLWYDNISRGLLASGAIAKLVTDGVITGITTNPTIFQKAVESGGEYDAEIRVLAAQGLSAEQIYDRLTIADVQAAADALKPVWERTQGKDGYVSLEVLPRFAADANATLQEGKRLFKECGRQNVMIKVPGTKAGVEAFRLLTEGGVNVNVTLLFSLEQYEAIAQAWIAALRQRMKKGFAVHTLASVASFFVSRVDSAIDAQLEASAKGAAAPVAAERLALRGKAAVANCKAAYARFRELFGKEFDDCRAKGARVQRMLWASTSTKNPAYDDLIYVENLFGPDTVNTMPPATLDAFLHHGAARSTTLLEKQGEALETLKALHHHDVDLGAVCQKLQDDGVAAFAKSFDTLIAAIEKKRGG
ncbi:MAG: transaldolase [Planctomycetes bacterium]|nr:transaldolase [Planctomycetota bacterium]